MSVLLLAASRRATTKAVQKIRRGKNPLSALDHQPLAKGSTAFFATTTSADDEDYDEGSASLFSTEPRRDGIFGGGDELRLLETRTQALLDHSPVGSWTEQHWRTAIHLLDQWTHDDSGEARKTQGMPRRTQIRRISDDNKLSSQRGTAGSVLSSFALLERLLVEQQRSKGMNLLALEIIHTDVLNDVIRNWSICWSKQHQSMDKKKHPDPATAGDAEQMAKVLLEFSPDNVLSRIKAYQMRSRARMIPNKYTYHSLMEGAAASRAPLFAIRILDLMANDSIDGTNNHNQHADDSNPPSSLLDRETYSKFINTAARMGDASQAEKILDHMHNQFVKTGNHEDFRPTTLDFNAVLRAWAKGSDGNYKRGSDRSQKILQRMVDMSSSAQEDGEIRANPDHLSYTWVFKAITNWIVSVKDAKMIFAKDYQFVGEMAEGLLDDMQNSYVVDGVRNVRPDATHYNSVLFIWSQLGNAERAEALLERMHQEYKVYRNRRAEPNTTSFNCVLNAWIHSQTAAFTSTSVYNSMNKTASSSSDAGKRAETILRRMEELHGTGELRSVRPNSDSYFALIRCWGESRSKEAGDRALAVLRKAETLQKKTGAKLLRSESYGAVIHAYANAGLAPEAEKVATEFHRQFHEKGNQSTKPTMLHLSMLLNAWAKSGHPDAPHRGETILREAERLYGEGLLDRRPDVVSYTAVLECFSKSNQVGAAEKLLDEMNRRATRNGETHLKPNLISYHHVLNAYATLGWVEKAEALLGKIMEEFKRGNDSLKPTIRVMNLVLAALSNSSVPGAGHRAFAFLDRIDQLVDKDMVKGRPDVVTYTVLLKCLANSPDAGKQAESVLDKMEARAAQGETTLAPNTLSYSTVIQIYGRAGKPEQAEELLERMHRKYMEGNKDVQPNVRTFTSVLQAWSRSSDARARERGLVILERMKELAKEGALDDISPNTFTYAAVLGCVNTSKGGSQVALQLFDEWEQLGEQNDNDDADVCYNYNLVLEALALDGDGIEGQRMMAKWYHDLENGNVTAKPNLRSWNLLLQAWSNSKDRDSHVRAELVFERLKALHESSDLDAGPNAHTFVMLFSCYAKGGKDVDSAKIHAAFNEFSLVESSVLSMYEHLTIIRSLCQLRDGEYLIMADQLLQKMLREYDRAGPKWRPNSVRAAFKALMVAWESSRERQGTEYARRLRHQLRSLDLN